MHNLGVTKEHHKPLEDFLIKFGKEEAAAPTPEPVDDRTEMLAANTRTMLAMKAELFALGLGPKKES